MKISSQLARAIRVGVAGLIFAGCLSGAKPQESKVAVNEHHIVYHDVRIDSSGGIVPWSADKPSEAYDHDIRLIWNFWIHMRICPNGIPYYLQHQVWKAEEDDPRGLGGDQINMALDSWRLLYGYLGDPAIRQNMTMMADYWLAHGMSAPDVLWANLPYPYNLSVHSSEYDGDMRAGKGILQPDKAGSFGAELVMLYKMTGNRRYLTAAIAIANTLAARVTPGNANESPWPFRVNAATGQVAQDKKDGKIFTAAYTTNWTPTLELFSDLSALHQGQTEKYEKAKPLVIQWLKKYPLVTNQWGPFFEDIVTATYSDTEINADTMATYILEHPDWDPHWREQARGILQWSFSTFGNHHFESLHVVPINEQTAYRVPGNSHTSRHAATELLFCEKTGDCANNEQAVRQLNWATYSVDTDGKNRYPNDDVWLTDGYGDYVRHYLHAMASLPELAPDQQNHLLRTSSVVQEIKYTPRRISYRKFDSNSIELFKLGAAAPKRVTGGTMKWDANRKVLIVTSSKKQVEVSLAGFN
jgi:hypothetical protein